MRGKRPTSLPASLQTRITPAGAGKTRLDHRRQRLYWDHPRRCGENSTVSDFFAFAQGSPPQVRGKLSYSKNVLQLLRITPAGAGKTLKYKICKSAFKDHPRRCGENQRGRVDCCPHQGSPPQVRGKQTATDYDAYLHGITPAGAGKTASTDSTLISPHGSPPQVRGKLDQQGFV